MKYTLNCTDAKQSALRHIETIDISVIPIQTVTIANFRKGRTNRQNAYYFGVVLKAISDYTGYSVNELHELFKSNLLPSKVITIGDKNVSITPSTTELSVVDFNDYIEQIAQFAADTLGIYVPHPNERF